MGTPEEEFILSFLPVLRRYLSYRKIENLDNQLNLLESQLNSIMVLQSESDENEDGDEDSTSDQSTNSTEDDHDTNTESENSSTSDDNAGEDRDKLVMDITFHDLKDDVQQFIIDALGYRSSEQLIKAYPHLDGPVCSLEI